MTNFIVRVTHPITTPMHSYNQYFYHENFLIYDTVHTQIELYIASAHQSNVMVLNTSSSSQ